MSVSAGLGIHHTLISCWMRRYRRAGQLVATPQPASAAVPVPHADQASEIARLRREVERLRMERGILEKRIAMRASLSLRVRHDEVRCP
jgi:transposase